MQKHLSHLSPPPLPKSYELFFGSLGIIINRLLFKNRINPPLLIGKYRLVRLIPAHSSANNVSLGIYEYRNKRFFIKTWFGKIKDLNYYYLVNQLRTSDFLFSKLMQLRFPQSVYFPEVVGHVHNPDSLSVITKFISGRELGDYPVEQQAYAIAASMAALQKISDNLSPSEKKLFLSQGPVSQAILLPIIGLALIVASPENIAAILTQLFRCVKLLPRTLGQTLVLSHRDLTPDNILLSRHRIYILDTELAALTLPGYDLSFLAATPKFSLLAGLSSKLSKSVPNPFLTAYIKLHQSIGSGDFLSINPEYFNSLGGNRV
jgi:serine/threonine protein kinase